MFLNSCFTCDILLLSFHRKKEIKSNIRGRRMSNSDDVFKRVDVAKTRMVDYVFREGAQE